MGFFLLLVSLVLMVTGVTMILMPKKVVKFATDLLSDSKEPKLLGLIPLFLGVLLLFSVSSTVLGWLIVLLGLAQFAKAVYIFLTPVQKMKSHWWFSLSDNGHRALGILVLILGVIVFISMEVIKAVIRSKMAKEATRRRLSV